MCSTNLEAKGRSKRNHRGMITLRQFAFTDRRRTRCKDGCVRATA
jgi:hypothetical protein